MVVVVVLFCWDGVVMMFLDDALVWFVVFGGFVLFGELYGIYELFVVVGWLVWIVVG